MGKVFFGQLRAAEMEVRRLWPEVGAGEPGRKTVRAHRALPHPQHLLERSWYAVTETCLAFTVFRDDFSPRFVALFTLLLFLKCFHWLAEDRVDFVSWVGGSGGREWPVGRLVDGGGLGWGCGVGPSLPDGTPLCSASDGTQPQYLLALSLPHCL